MSEENEVKEIVEAKKKLAEVKKKINEVKGYRAVEVPTQYGVAVANPNDDVLTQEQVNAEILNKLDQLIKAVV